MKIKRIYRTILASAILALTAAGCGVNEITIDDGTVIPDNDRGEINGSMESFPVWGTVTDSKGQPLSGVTVSSGDISIVSDINGFFSLDQTDVNNGRFLVRFSKEGYFPVVRSADASDRDPCGLNVALASADDPMACRKEYSAENAQTLEAGGMKISLPADCYSYAATGEKYSGMVKASMYYLSPEADEFSQLMPGSDLAGVGTSGMQMQLISYGMTNVLLSDDQGRQLQLSGNAKAEMSFPTPAAFAENPPQTIPLWWFDETKGLWIEEGKATRNSDGQYVGEASHFTWWNLDPAELEATLEGYVTNVNGEPLEGIRIRINGQYYSKPTDANGYYCVKVMANTIFHVCIPSAEYGNYTPEQNYDVGPIPENSVGRQDFILPIRYRIIGEVVDEDDNPVVGSYQLTIPGEETTRWMDTDSKGKFTYYLPWECKGEGKVSVCGELEGYYSIVEDQPFDIPGDNDVYVRIVVLVDDYSRPAGGAHTPDITASCEGEATHYLKVRRPGVAEFGGVVLQGNHLTAFSGVGDYSTRMFALDIPNYSESQTHYSDFRIMATDGRRNIYCEGGELIISRDGDIYIFNAAAEGLYMLETDNGMNVKEAKITVNYIGLWHLMTLERRENYSVSAPFPGFTPSLSQPAPVAMLITKSHKLGTGGFLYYNGNMDGFQTLTEQADRSGLDRDNYDVDNDNRRGNATYTRGTSSIVVDADVSIGAINSDSWKGVPMFNLFSYDNDDTEDYEYESQLMVTSLEGGYMSLMESEYGFTEEMEMAMKSAKAMRRKLRKATGKSL